MKKETLKRGRSLDNEICQFERLLADPMINHRDGFSLELRLVNNRYSDDISGLLSEEMKNKIAVIKQVLYDLVLSDLQAQLAALEKEFEELSDETMTDNQ